MMLVEVNINLHFFFRSAAGDLIADIFGASDEDEEFEVKSIDISDFRFLLEILKQVL